MNAQTITLRADVALYGVALGLFAIAGLVVLATAHLPPAVDWDGTYRPAAQALMRLENPYAAVDGFYNPPWALLPLSPFIAARDAGRGAVFIVSLGVYALVAVRMGAKPVPVGLFLTSPPVLHSLLNGNLEWLVLLGVVLPPRWGLFLVLLKPQVTGGLAVYWVVDAWRAGSWRRIARLIWPVTVALLASFALYGLWPLRARHMPELWWNASLWPLSIPGGVLLLVWATWKREPKAALASSPLLAPYVLLHAWAGAVVALSGHTRALGAVWMLLWGLVFIQI